MGRVVVFLVCLLGGATLAVKDDSSTYLIGTGRFDITGPSTEIEFVSFKLEFTPSHLTLLVILVVFRWAMEYT